MAEGAVHPAFSVVPIKAITNERWERMPHRLCQEPWDLIVRGCRGQRVNAAFYLVGGEPVENLLVKVRGGWNVDCRWIKWWWQAGRTNMENDRSVYIPELLVHDFNLVQSSPHKYEVNKYPWPPNDTKKMTPANIGNDGFMPGFEQGVMLTVTIPPDAESGWHDLRVEVSCSDQVTVLPCRVYVYPFDLVPSSKEYSIYYRARLCSDDRVDMDWRSPRQMLADLRDMVQHGVKNPICTGGDGEMERVLRLRFQAGCDNENLMSGVSCGPAVFREGYDPLNLPQMQNEMARWCERLVEGVRKYGVKNLFVYGRDEGDAEQIRAQVPLWDGARRGGAKVYIAVSGMPVTPEIMPYLPEQVHKAALRSTPAEIQMLLDAGKRVFLYGRPGGGNEAPDDQRRGQGVQLWLTKATGSCEYAWQHVWCDSKDAWDDFGRGERQHFRSHMYTYPTVDGCVDTLQWEGFAEGITDGRYLATLATRMAVCPDTQAKVRAQNFLDYVRQDAALLDLDAMRLQCAQLIEEVSR